MHRLIWVLCLGIAGCTANGVSEDGAYRVAAAPIYSNAGFQLGRMEGQWNQIAAFGQDQTTGCRAGGADFSRRAGVMQVDYQLCLDGRNVVGRGTIDETGPGRFAIGGKDGIGQDWWVLWVDEGYRTMAIGSPSGGFGFILNRGKDLPADRLQAAREVLDFNGYNLEKLDVF